MFFDAHIHSLKNENGGFVIGLEGEPKFDGTLNNEQALAYHNAANNYLAFYYVKADEINAKSPHKYLKYHPRRECYSPQQVIAHIAQNKPKCVMIDTLNEPHWLAYDYWKVAREFSDLPFILPHAGGYLINDFIKICHFQKNIWLDFALTHTVLGRLGDAKTALPYVNQAISYALNSPFRERILLSSDYPFFAQDVVVDYYRNNLDLLNNNFLTLLEKIK